MSCARKVVEALLLKIMTYETSSSSSARNGPSGCTTWSQNDTHDSPRRVTGMFSCYNPNTDARTPSNSSTYLPAYSSISTFDRRQRLPSETRVKEVKPCFEFVKPAAGHGVRPTTVLYKLPGARERCGRSKERSRPGREQCGRPTGAVSTSVANGADSIGGAADHVNETPVDEVGEPVDEGVKQLVGN
ncbi:hypothetical protein FIBSPDRAFT_885263 [Athelia psychrophila]|uniref:Uncharacterized protein n=1 Tax=Athelia psychrophila TaxID=1759441 RepID=A0A166S9L3_9AGAM|nr:hypothetical protein FIBSPDRAFT_885263 [Fibularhizoctonia sp. CBS 109695]